MDGLDLILCGRTGNPRAKANDTSRSCIEGMILPIRHLTFVDRKLRYENSSLADIPIENKIQNGDVMDFCSSV